MTEAPSPGASPSQSKTFYVCACFYRENIFLEDYRLHVRYLHEQQFRRDYEMVLRDRGCRSSEQFRRVLEKIEKEVQRRTLLGQQSIERRTIIAQCYEPLHPEVYILQDSFLAPEFLETVKFCTSQDADVEGLLRRIQPVSDRIYCLPVFIPEYCRDLVEELEMFEQSQMPKGRPNTMNNYGVLLNELGFDDTFVTPLRERYLQPLTSLLYPDCGGGYLDSHKAFVVKYSMEEDLDLSCHYDNAEVTLNVCLGKAFTDGNLYFSDMRQVNICPAFMKAHFHVVLPQDFFFLFRQSSSAPIVFFPALTAQEVRSHHFNKPKQILLNPT
ncbi:2-oxoglutarate and iron-dependent oxygenase domain-containing protein 2 isoform X2 [Rhinatrema bivittatum]|uniref:2-oxoglutarate and iron-dependent oxygenase domain-containing protein 2 isoform X2 n=1 Tax=Rhinatrema bivittatum TaxID=194408 RepID=UPI001129D75C|nr:2-oxoglutarate and iron-dependent oxygenase domain-containing protein 2 isoform X2 [Rhinatrema bivittatum]